MWAFVFFPGLRFGSVCEGHPGLVQHFLLVLLGGFLFLLWVLRVCALPYQALGTALNLFWAGQFPVLCHSMSFYSEVRRG